MKAACKGGGTENRMRKEATSEQWGALYEAATHIKEKKPWEKFGDMDLIGTRDKEAEDMVFLSIPGSGGDCYGMVAYEGYEGLNTFLMLLKCSRHGDFYSHSNSHS